jgi:hypothetical protein
MDLLLYWIQLDVCTLAWGSDSKAQTGNFDQKGDDSGVFPSAARHFSDCPIVIEQALLFKRARISGFKVIVDQILRKTAGFMDESKSGYKSQFGLRLTSEQVDVLAICG